MQNKSDAQLLREYAAQGSEPAFAEIVARHTDLVYTSALRQTGSPELAREIAQSVFTDLARKARALTGTLSADACLAGWLFRGTRFAGLKLLRDEHRRQNRERQFMEHFNPASETAPDWERVAPVLDEAMAELGDADHEAVLLRYFKNQDFHAVGLALGVSDAAAQKRVSRAVEHLRQFFASRGVKAGASGLVTVISANSVQAAPLGLAKAISVVAMAQGAATSGSIMVFVKGLLKPVFTSSAGTLAALTPLLGSVFFHLKAEVENAKSPRERQFLVRMIWFRFTIALLGTAVPIVIALMMPSIIKQPGVIEYGFAGYFFCVAVEVAARTVYFHRRRRLIQIEDGTFEEFDPGKPTRPAELLGDLRDKTSKSNRYAAMAAVFGLAGSTLFSAALMTRMMAEGHWIVALLILLGFGFATFRWIRNWRQRPRFVFDARFGTLAKIMVFCAVMSLLLFDLSWAHGRLHPSSGWAIAFNILVVLAYAVLIKILAQVHRPLAAAPDSPSISTQIL